MRKPITLLSIAAIALSAMAGAAQPAGLVTAEAGRDVSTAFLLELTNPLRTMAKYRVGIVYADPGIGLLIAPKGSPPVVEYIAGAGEETRFWSRALASAAIEQVQNPRRSEFRFHVIRKILTAQNCPGLADSLAKFYTALEAALSVPVNLAGPPALPRAIVSDAAGFSIHVVSDGAILSLSRLGESGHPLAHDENSLTPVLSECLASVLVSAEQEYTFSYQQAFVLRRGDAP